MAQIRTPAFGGSNAYWITFRSSDTPAGAGSVRSVFPALGPPRPPSQEQKIEGTPQARLTTAPSPRVALASICDQLVDRTGRAMTQNLLWRTVSPADIVSTAH